MLPCSLGRACGSVCAPAATSTVPPFPELWQGAVSCAGAQPCPGSSSTSSQAISVTRSHPSPWPRRPDISLGHQKTCGFSWPAPAGSGAGQAVWKGQMAHVSWRRNRFSPCLPHSLHQAPLPTVLTPRTCLPASPRVEGTGCQQPALHWGVHAWLAACPGDTDLLRREKPCVEFFPLRRKRI